MRVFVITKRQYMRYDLLDQRFGRFREIPLALARRGHSVRGACLSYAQRPEVEIRDDDESRDVHVTWRSFNAGRLKLIGLARYVRAVEAEARAFAPDVIWACSDSFYGIIGHRIARRVRSRCVFDLYDNFESFGSTYLPGVRRLYRRTVRETDGVTCISDALAAKVVDECRRTKPTRVLVNAIRKDIFVAASREHCRRELGLPSNAQIIGTAGALLADRGIDTFFQAFHRLNLENPLLHLAIAGPRDRRTKLPSGPRVHDFGVLPLERVPTLINALDVGVVCNKDSAFGRYTFPQKAYEILACGRPLVAADVGSMRGLLSACPACLFRPGDADDLVRAIKLQLAEPFRPRVDIPGWDQLSAELETFFYQIADDPRSQPSR
jgi:teichuronic acid biosynthesis glycosyltransferase TuaC